MEKEKNFSDQENNNWRVCFKIVSFIVESMFSKRQKTQNNPLSKFATKLVNYLFLDLLQTKIKEALL